MRASRPPTRSLDLFRSPAAAGNVSGGRQRLERILRALGPIWQGTLLRRVMRACTNLRFYLLALVLTAALGGILLSGFVAAIPLLTRGLLFSAGNVQLGLGKHWGMVPPVTGAVWLSLLLFAGVFLLGLLGPRFWCRHVCPTGALLSLTGWFRRYRRQVDDRCVVCGKCQAACPFDAIQPDFGTRTLNCAFCQTCAGVCPTEAIHFVPLTAPAPGGKPEVRLGQGLTRRGTAGSARSRTASPGRTQVTPGMACEPAPG